MPQPIMESVWGLYAWAGKQWYERVQGLVWPKSDEQKRPSIEDTLRGTPERKAADSIPNTSSKALSPSERLERLERLGLAKDRLEAIRKQMLERKRAGGEALTTPDSILPKELQRVMLWEPADIRKASVVLGRNLIKHYKPPGSGARLRGAFTVKGEVGMAGPKAQAKMVVWAEYHPDYGYTYVSAALVALLPHVQSPRGGP